MTAFLTIAAVWLLPSALVGLWIAADRLLAVPDPDLDDLLASDDPWVRHVAQAVAVAQAHEDWDRWEAEVSS